MTGKDTLAVVRDATATTAGLSGVAYACGYLALRARARALGIDPGFNLLDEIYVFAGFRFALSFLFALLLLTPIIGVGRTLAGKVRTAPNLSAWFSGLAVFALAANVLVQFKALDVHGLLLEPNAREVLDQAALGANGWGVALFFSGVAGVVLGAMWVAERLRKARYGGVTPALAILVATQVIFLPVIEGVFFADRGVRVLERAPAAAPTLAGPVGLIDRGKDKVVLLSVAADGGPRLVSLAADSIDGVGEVRSVTLSQFLVELRAASLGLGLAASTVIVQPSAAQAQPHASAGAPASADSRQFWQVIFGELKHTLENIGSLGEGRATSGAVFVAEIDGAHLVRAPTRLGASADLSWPVIGADGQVFALRSGRLVRLSSAGFVQPVDAVEWRKLVGVGTDGVVAGLLADPAPFGRPALLTKGGVLQSGPAAVSPEDRRRQGMLLQESQALDGGRSLRVARSSRGGRGFDVYYAQSGLDPLDVSDCGDDSCGQPSISPDGSKVVYIRAPH